RAGARAARLRGRLRARAPVGAAQGTAGRGGPELERRRRLRTGVPRAAGRGGGGAAPPAVRPAPRPRERRRPAGPEPGGARRAGERPAADLADALGVADLPGGGPRP